ncbi:MAG: ferredoxin [Christensenellales bacterium]
MRAIIDRDGCILCGLCADVCPEVFRMGDDGPAETITEQIPKESEDSAAEAAEGCPVEVIRIED